MLVASATDQTGSAFFPGMSISNAAVAASTTTINFVSCYGREGIAAAAIDMVGIVILVGAVVAQ